MDFLKSGGKTAAKTTAPSAAAGGGFLQPNEISKGDQVKHDTFGIGKVLQVEAVAGDALVAIQFPSGTKRLMAKYAKLRKA